MSGKSAKLVSKDKSVVYKEISKNELHFYLYMNSLTINDLNFSLTKFIPVYRGTITIQPKITKKESKIAGQKDWLDHI